QIKSGALSDSIAAGDEAIGEIVTNAARILGISVANVVNLLGPDRIILGGGLVEKLHEMFLDPVRDAIQRCSMPALAEGVTVVQAELGDDAVTVGAAAFAKRTTPEHSE
ncbi:MAG: ROK family protein, partial [Verrucomicrobiota bacterium]